MNPKEKKKSPESFYLIERLIECLQLPVQKYKKHNEKQERLLAESTKTNKSNADRELILAQKFCVKYKGQDLFANNFFTKLFACLVNLRLLNKTWKAEAAKENVLYTFKVLRILLRDKKIIKNFDGDGVKSLAQIFGEYSIMHIESPYDIISKDTAKEMTKIVHRLALDHSLHLKMVELEFHKNLLLLLSTTDIMVLHSTLYTLGVMTESDVVKKVLGETHCMDMFLRILSQYDAQSQQLVSTILRELCTNPTARNQLKTQQAIPLFLSLLQSGTLKLIWNIVWIVVQLSDDTSTSDEVRLLGGIPILIALLKNEKFEEEKEIEESFGLQHEEHSTSELKLSLKSAVCAALTELVVNDLNARSVVQANGIYIIVMLVLTCRDFTKTQIQLQKHAVRCLRFLFSMERNRQLFKRLFPSDLFEAFIEVGHYERDLQSYTSFVQRLNNLDTEEYNGLLERAESTNMKKEAIKTIQSYSVYEYLGSGAFGTVFKVKKKGGHTFFAMKQISARHADFGKGKVRHEKIESLINECSFVKKQMEHENIVKYHKAFIEGESVYIIMELIDGAPLADHFCSLREKKQKFSEKRVWRIFVQMVLALRYIHKEKKIVHRDLSPNNIMLGEEDKVTLTDFGLARERHPDVSKMTSMVGTVLYSCPEIIRGVPYNEKADVWGVGCILYEMCALTPPFYSTNMLSLANKIASGDYKPIEDSFGYSPLVSIVVDSCLEVKPEVRPDIVKVASLIPEILMEHMEQSRQQLTSTEKRLNKERKRSENCKCRATRSRNDSESFDNSCESLNWNENDVIMTSSSNISVKNGSQQVFTFGPRENVQRTNSCSYLDHLTERAMTPTNLRPISASALSISPRKVRQINDPLAQLLSQLHKIVFVSQLPPPTKADTNRSLIDQYKRSLFSLHSSFSQLKIEMKKLSRGSKELVDLCQNNNQSTNDEGISYEQLQVALERILTQERYYS